MQLMMDPDLYWCYTGIMEKETETYIIVLILVIVIIVILIIFVIYYSISCCNIFSNKLPLGLSRELLVHETRAQFEAA